MPVTTDKNHIKIAIPISSGPQSGADETLWAHKIDDKLAKIDNIPGHAKNIALGDIVEYKKVDNDFIFGFVKVAQKSNNKTIRILFSNSIFKKRTKIFLEKIFPELAKFGCEYEGDTGSKVKVVGINIPQQVKLADIFSVLSKYKQQGFDYEVLSE